MSPTDNMIFSDILLRLQHTIADPHRAPLVLKHTDIELVLLANKVRERSIPWTEAWRVLDESMPYDILRPRSSVDSITVDKLFRLITHWVPVEHRNEVLARVSGKLAETRVGPWETLDFIAEAHFVEKEPDEE